MSSTNEYITEQREEAHWARLDKRLDGIDARLAAIEGATKEKERRRVILREFFDDLGRWTVYVGKLVGSVIVIVGAVVALVAWMARHG